MWFFSLETMLETVSTPTCPIMDCNERDAGNSLWHLQTAAISTFLGQNRLRCNAVQLCLLISTSALRQKINLRMCTFSVSGADLAWFDRVRTNPPFSLQQLTRWRVQAALKARNCSTLSSPETHQHLSAIKWV